MKEDFKDNNQKTVQAYDYCYRRQEIKEVDDAPQSYFDWLNKTVEGLDKSAKIFEFGSGAGYDALYLQSLGYEVACSEAAESAVGLLRGRGLAANKIDVLVDQLPADCQLILALGVVVHFNPAQLQLACDKVFAALTPAGRFALSTVDGQAQEWYRDKYDQTRYLSHLPQKSVEAVLKQSGFGRVEVDREVINDEVASLEIIAYK